MRRLLVVCLLALGCSKTSFNEPAPDDCTPNCQGKICGNDGCGGSCGLCAEAETCSVAGTCVPVCVPNCTTMMCGDDGCGGSCGDCAAPTPLCAPNGRCVDCLPDCTGRICGDDGCGGSCGTCDQMGIGFTCDNAGQCQCTDTCGARECGVVCEEVCGVGFDCGVNMICNEETGMCEACTPDCNGRVCGPDGCNGTCGDCNAGERCLEAGTCEDCQCGTAECDNDDGCCGFCPANAMVNLTCTMDGLCSCDMACTPDCTGKNCGPDGCGGTCGAECGAGQVCSYDRAGGTAVDCRAFTASPMMSFFVSSIGNTINGGNFGGLEGADQFCQTLAAAAGAGGRTWVAYLSITGTAAASRIGNGPWYDAAGQPIVPESCGMAGDCVTQLHAGNVMFENVRTETGATIDVVNENAVFTGSDANGNPTGIDCQGWFSSDENDMATAGLANAGAMDGTGRWNSGQMLGCDWTSAACAMGRAHVYCFSP